MLVHEISGDVFRGGVKYICDVKFINLERMTIKKGHQKFWWMKRQIFGEKCNFRNFSLQNFFKWGKCFIVSGRMDAPVFMYKTHLLSLHCSVTKMHPRLNIIILMHLLFAV